MASTEAIARAALAWMDPKTKHIKMETELCEAFGNIIDEIIQEKETYQTAYENLKTSMSLAIAKEENDTLFTIKQK